MLPSRLSLLAMSAGLMSQACVVHSSSDGNGGAGGQYHGTGGSYGGSGGAAPPPTGTFFATWEITGAQTACGTNWYVDIDVQNQTTGADYHDSFSCSGLNAVTIPFPTGTYAVAVRLRDGTGSLLSEAPLPGTYVLASGQPKDLGIIQFTVAGQPIPDQYYIASWAIYPCFDTACTSVGTTELTCADAGADWIVMTVDSTFYVFTCSDADHVVRTPTIPSGTHTVSFELQDAWGISLATTSTVPISLAAGVPLTLPPVDFLVY